MATSTKQRGATQAQLAARQARAEKVRAEILAKTPCVACGEPLGMHSRVQVHDCAMARS